MNKLIHLGITGENSLIEVKRIKLLNQIVLLFSGLLFCKTIQEILFGDLVGGIISIAIITLVLGTLFLHFYQKMIAAKIYFVSILTVCTMAINMSFGRGFGIEFSFFPIIISVIIFFDTQITRLFWILLFVCSYCLSILFLEFNEPFLIDNLSESTYYFMFISSLIAVFLAFSFFMRENRNYELKTEELFQILESKNDGLENANKELERFAYVASHDLKTPLRNITSFLNLIQRKIKKGKTDEIGEYLEFAALNAKRMYNLIEDVLEFSRFSNGEFPFQKEDLTEILELSISNVKEMINTKNALINYSRLPNSFCNKTQMISLFQNLIENAIKYNISETPIINITWEDKDKEYEILISDNGIGIEKQYQAKIFDMFYRLHGQGEYEGSGIGLSSCKKIITYHGGKILLDSEINKGSTFYISLPKVNLDKTSKQ